MLNIGETGDEKVVSFKMNNADFDVVCLDNSRNDDWQDHKYSAGGSSKSMILHSENRSTFFVRST